MADDLLKRTQTWKLSVWCLLTIALTFYATDTIFSYFRTEKNMSPTKEVVFPKIILFGDSITQVSVPFFSKRSTHLSLCYFVFEIDVFINFIYFIIRLISVQLQ